MSLWITLLDAKRACGRCRSGPRGAAHAGEPLRRVSKRMAVRDEACGARAGEPRRAMDCLRFLKRDLRQSVLRTKTVTFVSVGDDVYGSTAVFNVSGGLVSPLTRSTNA